MPLSVVSIVNGELEEMRDGSGLVRWETISDGVQTVEQWEGFVKAKPLGFSRNVSLTPQPESNKPGALAFKLHVDEYEDQIFGVKMSSMLDSDIEKYLPPKEHVPGELELIVAPA